jgi:oxygen-dependent protoporphyrinogen oxidase
VDEVRQSDDRFSIGGNAFDDFLVATDAATAAAVLRGTYPEIAAQLAEIPLVSTVTVTLGYDLAVVPKPLAGHGYVIPRIERRPCLAVTWTSSKWKDRTPPGKAQIRLFLGRAGDQGWVDASDEEIIAAARAEAADTLAITADPAVALVTRWRNAMPQYELGHRARTDAIETAARAIPGLHVAGNYLRGVGIPDCVREARAVAARLAARYSPASS